jgi:hypothetical protein
MAFPANGEGKLTASVGFENNIAEPVISYEFISGGDGWYTLGFTGMPQLDPAKADGIWQPPVWQERRFPEKPFFSTHDVICALPGTMVENEGVTYGVMADPRVLPYELPDQPSGKILFGVVLRNQQGNAQPMLFSPVLGNPNSRLAKGTSHSFKIRLFAYQGTQPDAYISLAKNMFSFKDYRENVYVNLNQTIENIIDFQMDDVYSRWSTDMKGFDYSTDIANTVKNVSGLHPLSVALITDNQGIYTRRALPIIEYLISRQKYLFSVDKNITRQGTSSLIAGPAVEVSELAAYDIYYKGKTPVFRYFADSLKNTTRKLNLVKDSKGDDWPNLLELYRMSGNKSYLERAKQKADDYIKWRITTRQTDFSDSNTEQAAMFWTDYTPLWMEMLSLYENTREKRYLDAAVAGAKQYMQHTWFYPVIPDSTLVVNKDGISKYLCTEAVREKIPPMPGPRQEVPAWRVSQIGLTSESTYTAGANPAIFLANQAAHLLRLAYYTNDDFFRAAGRAAVVGRYSNYPGYDINGEFNTIYSRADYPLRYQHEVSYNQFYYNHVWPQIALLFDYLISDTYVLSKENINFEPEFAVGYAYLKSNVYGQKEGSFYGDKNVTLWMPKQVLKVDNEQVNYLTAFGNNKFYMAFTNQSNRPQEAEITLNPDLVPVNMSGTNTAVIRTDNGKAQNVTIKNGKVRIKLSPKGITAIVIDDVSITTQFQQKTLEENSPGNKSFRMADSQVGKIRSALISYGKVSSAYVWLEGNTEKVKGATFSYRLPGDKEWKKVTDSSYPFELSVPLHHNEKTFEFSIDAETPDRRIEKIQVVKLER